MNSEHTYLTFEENIKIVKKLLKDKNTMQEINLISKKIIDSLKNSGTIYFVGNGGSAGDAAHMAAEYVGRFNFNRKGLRAIALTSNPLTLTAIANDFSYEDIFSRQIECFCKKGDVVFLYSTSGRSKNIINGLKKANEIDVTSVGFTGINKELMSTYCDFLISVPSSNTARIQEIHLLIGHIICERVEHEIFKRENV